MKKINLLIVLVSVLISLYYCYSYIEIKKYANALSSLIIIPLMLAPLIITKIIKKSNIWIESIYIVFIFLAQVLGSVVGLYHSFSGYDKIVHMISGIVTSFLGVYILYKFKKGDNKFFNIIFIVIITLAIAAIWELIEYNIDNIFKTDVQWVSKTGINDTMTDIISALIGTCLFNICYLFEICNDKKMIVTKFINSLN